MSRLKICKLCMIVFGCSILGWVVFGLFLPPSAVYEVDELSYLLSEDPRDPWQFLLFIVGALVPIFAGLGWFIASLSELWEFQGEMELDHCPYQDRTIMMSETNK